MSPRQKRKQSTILRQAATAKNVLSRPLWRRINFKCGMLQKPFCPNQGLSQSPLSKQMQKRGRSLATPCRQGQRSATAMCRSCTRKHRALSNTGEGFKQRPKNCDYSPAHEKQTKEKKSKAPAPEKRGGEAKQASPPNLGIPRKIFPVGGTTRVQAPQPPTITKQL